MNTEARQEPLLNVVSAYVGMQKYIDAVLSDPQADVQALWEEHVLDAYWQEWASGQFNETRTRQELATPMPREYLSELENELRGLAASGVEDLARMAHARITAELPPPLPEMAVCILAADPADHALLQEQNGVVGSCVGDNILLRINPAGADWQRWVPYVMAHEYNHTIAGYVHFYIKGSTSATLLQSMVFEGLADCFADQLFPGLDPIWTRALTPRQEAEQWQILQSCLDSTSPDDYLRFIFGRESSGTPRFTGYTIGCHIVKAAIAARPELSMADLVMKSGEELLALGGYGAGI